MATACPCRQGSGSNQLHAWAAWYNERMKAALAVKVVAPLLAVVLCVAAAAAPVTNNVARIPRKADVHESNLADFVADAVRSQAGTPIAILTASELRSVVVPAGRIDSDQIVRALRAPSDPTDTVVVLRLTGAQIIKALERGFSSDTEPI